MDLVKIRKGAPRIHLVGIALAIIGCEPAANMGPNTFEEVTEGAGIRKDTGEILSVAWLDYNGDGWLDLWLGNHFGQHGSRPFLYVSQQDGTFENVIDAVWSADPAADTHGGAWADFDNDGDPDLIELVGGGRGVGLGKSHFFENRGGILVERAPEVGLDYPLGQGRMPNWYDWDRDGRLDAIMVSPPRRLDGNEAPTTILRQLPDGTFEDVRAESGIEITRAGSAVQIVDIDADDVLDLVLDAVGSSNPHRVYLGSDVPFTDRAQQLFPGRRPAAWGMTWADFDGDLRSDAYFLRRVFASQAARVNDTLAVVQFMQGGRVTLQSSGVLRIRDEHESVGRLRPEAVAVRGGAWAILAGIPIILGSGRTLGPGIDRVSLDPDSPDVRGFPDPSSVDEGLLVGYDPVTETWTLHFVGHRLDRQAKLVLATSDRMDDVRVHGVSEYGRPDVIWFNRGPQEGVERAAIGPERPASCTSAAAGDFDNDMDVDLYLSCVETIRNRPNILLENLGGGRFVEVPEAGGAWGDTVGFGVEAMNKQGRVITADYDRDGHLDLLVAGMGEWYANSERVTEVPFIPTLLYRNRGSRNHWLQIDLVGTVSNRDGVGARVFVYAGGRTQLRENGGGVRWYAQDGMRLHFGLGANSIADSVQVRWPSGIRQTLRAVEADQILSVSESR
jgi:hypothetical protein